MLQSPSPSAPISHWLLTAEGWSQVLCILPMAETPPERHSSVPYSLFNEPLDFRPFVDARLSRSGWDVKRFLKDFSALGGKGLPFPLGKIRLSKAERSVKRIFKKSGRGGLIRTGGILLPKQAR